MLRSLCFQHKDDGARDAGVGCDMHRFHQSLLMRTLNRFGNPGNNSNINPLSYPKLGMQSGRRLVMPWFGTVFEDDSDQWLSPKHPNLHQGSISLVSRMIELHGYHMTSYMMTCEAHLPLHRTRAPGDPIVTLAPGCVV